MAIQAIRKNPLNGRLCEGTICEWLLKRSILKLPEIWHHGIRDDKEGLFVWPRTICRSPAGNLSSGEGVRQATPVVPAASNYTRMMRRGIFNIEWPNAHAGYMISSLAILVYRANRTLTRHRQRHSCNDGPGTTTHSLRRSTN